MPNKEKLNFVFFQPDEMRAESLGCYGHPLIKTPNYDRLADEGVRFDQCFVQNAQCVPSRVSMMTGLYPHCSGHRTNWHLIRGHEPHLFRYMHEAGYDIRWFGKNDMLAEDSLDCINEYYEPMGPTRINRFKLSDPEYYTFAAEPFDCPREELADAVKVKAGIEYLAKRKANDPPFFLFLPLLQPHPSYTTHREFYQMYDAADIPDLRPAELAGKPDYYRLIRQYRRLDELPRGFLRELNAIYLGMISYTDWLLGELLEALRVNGLVENTVVFVSSDHGDWAGDFGLVEKWPSDCSDPILRVPLIVRMPGGKSGHVVNSPIEMFDLMASVMDLADLETDHIHFAKSFVSMLNGGLEDESRFVFAEGGYDVEEPHAFEGKWSLTNPPVEGNYYPKGRQQQEVPESVCRATMLRSSDYKLVRRSRGQDELYDLKNDPRELCNEIDNPAMAKVRSTLEQEMLDWFLRTSDTVPMNTDRRGFGGGKLNP